MHLLEVSNIRKGIPSTSTYIYMYVMNIPIYIGCRLSDAFALECLDGETV